MSRRKDDGVRDELMTDMILSTLLLHTERDAVHQKKKNPCRRNTLKSPRSVPKSQIAFCESTKIIILIYTHTHTYIKARRARSQKH